MPSTEALPHTSPTRGMNHVARLARPSRSLVLDIAPGAAPRVRPLMSPADRKMRIINLCAVLIPVVGLAAAIVFSWGVALNWVHLAVMGAMFLFTGLGITVGYHRLCTHKSFNTPAPIRYLLAAAGSMAAQGPVIEWCGAHRRHHQHSDCEDDPHSPHVGPDGSWGDGLRATLRGAWHAHIGWLFSPHQKGLGRYTRDLRADPVVVAVDRQFPIWVLIGLLIPAALGALLTWSWMGLLLGFLWGGLVRLLIVHHVTWSVNSVCHLWGTQPFNCRDESRNNLVVAVLAMGEGWHNNHHAFPTSARHGLRWWQFDLSYMVIKALSFVGLATDVRKPDADRIRTKQRPSGQ